MTPTAQRFLSTPFHCAKPNRVVRVQLTITPASPAPASKEHVAATSCEGADTCGVGTPDASGEFFSYDWSKCIHPRLSRG
jgi:hypothetical protein